VKMIKSFRFSLRSLLVAVTVAAVLCALLMQVGVEAVGIGTCVLVLVALLAGIAVAIVVGTMHLEPDVSQWSLIGSIAGAMIGSEFGRVYGAMMGGLVGAFVGDAIRDVRARRQDVLLDEQRWWQRPPQPPLLTTNVAFATLLCVVALGVCFLIPLSSVYTPADLVADYDVYRQESAGRTDIHVDTALPLVRFWYVYAFLAIGACDCGLSHARPQSLASVGRRLVRAAAANGLALILLALGAVTLFVQGFTAICPPVYGPYGVALVCFANWHRTIAVTQWPLLLCLLLALVTAGHLLWSRRRYGWPLAVGAVSVLVASTVYCGASYVCKYAVNFFATKAAGG
jgi:hypothetical protein